MKPRYPRQAQRTALVEPSPVVVGIGASAGGLEALERFLGSVPADSGLAFVVVQHQDPQRTSELPNILQRATALPVEPLADRTKLLANHVYVGPPGKDVSLLHGVAQLFELELGRPRALPIDFFFRALAEDQRERSVGIVLSGMGTDGTLGLAAIDEVGGHVLVQAPSTAAFDGMPRSAVATGLASLVAAPEQLALGLIATLALAHRNQAVEDRAATLEKIAVLLRTRTGNDFSFYKKSVLQRRVERRMSIHQIGTLGGYLRYLRDNVQEQDLLFRELLIGVTRFFRDPEAWDQLEKLVVPAIVAQRGEESPVRVWCVGCSTGEEAYSLAIVFREAIARLEPAKRIRVRIFATDLDPDAVDHARRGHYPETIAASVSDARLRRFFVRDDAGGYRVGREIRDMVTVAVHNLLVDPPFTRLDLLTCRNLLIYLEPEAQKQLFSLFHYSLEPNGALFLGSAETIASASTIFTTLDGRWRLFGKRGAAARARVAILPRSLSMSQPPGVAELPAPVAQARGVDSLGAAAERLLLDRFCPAAVLVSPEGEILFLSGRTGRYLEPPAGRANWNVFAMARDGLRETLERVFRKVAKRGTGTSIVRGLTVRGPTARRVDVTVHAVEEPEALRGMIVIAFAEAPKELRADAKGAKKGAKGASAEVRRADAEVRRLQRDLQAVRDAMQSSNEQLTCAYEEVQSTNEELQSTNEELTTSSEEMQSLNEELQTINAELQSKMEEVSGANNDMRNLLDSTDIATLFLDRALCVRRFTPQAARLFKLLPGDVGRPITDITSSLIHPSLADDVEQVLHRLTVSERDVRTVDGRWFAVRTMPYRTTENVIDGVVLTFMEATKLKRLEEENSRLREQVRSPR
jgi:two-component system CheB/CheR fusion protein